jgi:hypothetical protein
MTFYAIDIDGIKRNLDRCVKEDIDEFGKPAMIYNYHHSKNIFNTFDYARDWIREIKILEAQGLTKRPVKKDIKINTDEWHTILWVFQPLNKDGGVDAEKYKKITKLMQDPLAASIGYMTSGLCYLQIVKKVDVT